MRRPCMLLLASAPLMAACAGAPRPADGRAGPAAQDSDPPRDTGPAVGDTGADGSEGASALALRGEALDPPWPLPDFEALDQTGAVRTGADLRGQPTVAFFYRSAGGESCTTDACAFQALHPSFSAIGVRVVGISFSEPEANAAWDAVHDFPFELWTDGSRALALAWHAVDDAGASAPGRVAVLLDPSGAAVARYDWRLVPESRPDDVLFDSQRLYGGR